MEPKPLSWKKKLGFPIAKLLTQNLEYWRNAVLYDDWDCIGVIDGWEGAGKSVLAQQVAKFLDKDHEISPDRVVFTPEAFTEAVLKADKGRAIVWDEARGGLNRRRTMSATNNAITDMLAEIRQRNLFIIIVLPTFYELDRNVALWRARWLIHVYIVGDPAKRRFIRGRYRFYSSDAKKRLYCDTSQSRFYEYPAKKSAFAGKFDNIYVIPEEEYKKQKADALRAHGVKDEKKKKSPEETEEERLLADMKRWGFKL